MLLVNCTLWSLVKLSAELLNEKQHSAHTVMSLSSTAKASIYWTFTAKQTSTL